MDNKPHRPADHFSNTEVICYYANRSHYQSHSHLGTTFFWPASWHRRRTQMAHFARSTASTIPGSRAGCVGVSGVPSRRPTLYLTARPAEAIQEPRAYLTTLAKRVLFNFWRRRDLEYAYLAALASMPEHHMPSEEDRALVVDTLLAIDRALNTLPPLVREAFLLSQLYEMPYQEIADQLGISHMTVRRYMKQALTSCCYTLH
jgi:hypothetical protein